MASASSTVDKAAKLLRDRISELDSERAKVQSALASLTDGQEGKRGPGRPRGSARGRAMGGSAAGAARAAPARITL